MKAVDNINEIIAKFLSAYGEVKVECSTHFEYDFVDNIISWSFLTSERQDKTFSDYFERVLECPKCNTFIYSIFHEYGHKMTLGSFTELDWDWYLYCLDELGDIEDANERDYIYYQLPMERAASQWAVNFIKLHYDEIKLWFENEVYPSFDKMFNDSELAALISELVEGE